MIYSYEEQFAELVFHVMEHGEWRQTRNSRTKSVFAKTIVLRDVHNVMPLLAGRRIYFNGVLGELAAMLRGPEHVEDFEHWGCNYWKQWADEDGFLNVDYGNAWLEHGQIEHLKHCLQHDRTNRRMIINGWVPENLPNLSLPCCHYSYQFYVRNDKYIDMIWNQRSADLMIGVPSDAVFAAAWLKAIANEFGLVAGDVHMNLGDVHIYESHMDGAAEYLKRVQAMTLTHSSRLAPVAWWYAAESLYGKDFLKFKPTDLVVSKDYNPMDPIKFELIS